MVIDDLQYNRQVEMTLRKLGFEVESVNSEFNLNEPLLAFNPDYTVVRGQSARLNVLNVAKKLKEASNQNNKVILVFPQNAEITSEELFKIKADIILNEPISTLRLVMYLVSLSGTDIEFVKEKLLKYAITDSQFRAGEQQLLKSAGVTIDSEIELISNISRIEDMAPVSSNVLEREVEVIHEEAVEQDEPPSVNAEPEQPETAEVKREDAFIYVTGDFAVTDEVKQRLAEEIKNSEQEVSLRIESYNRTIAKVDQDLKKGLKKRQTKTEFNKLHKDLMAENKVDKKSEESLDNERIKFTKALFKK